MRFIVVEESRTWTCLWCEGLILDAHALHRVRVHRPVFIHRVPFRPGANPAQNKHRAIRINVEQVTPATVKRSGTNTPIDKGLMEGNSVCVSIS